MNGKTKKMKYVLPALAMLGLVSFANAQDKRTLISLDLQPGDEIPSIDGSGNNVANPGWGSAEHEFLRLTSVGYADGLDSPSGNTRPSARAVSNAVCAQEGVIENTAGASSYLWQWGQFLDHDIDETPLTDPGVEFNISVPAGDVYFDPFGTGVQEIGMTRSLGEHDNDGVLQQVNAITSYIDASNVYGSDETRANALRAFDGFGQLKMSRGGNLPFNEDGLPNAMSSSADFYLAGDVRANEQIALTAMHTLWVREHNTWCRWIRAVNNYQYRRYQHYIRRGRPDLAGPEVQQLDGDGIYETARRIVTAEMQAITFNEFLPVLLGEGAIPDYEGYDPNIDASITNVFATAAYRIGHTMLPNELLRLDGGGREIRQGNIALADAFFSPSAFQESAIEHIFMGLEYQKASAIDTKIVDGVRNFLFGPPGAGGFDLVSLNIQRGRDRGLPSYNQVRQDFGLSAMNSFSEISSDPDTVTALQSVYESVDDIDPWLGMLAEDKVPGAMVGETHFVILLEQFLALRDGDRFWYENTMDENLINFINDQKLDKVIKRNTRISDRHMSKNIFFAPDTAFTQ